MKNTLLLTLTLLLNTFLFAQPGAGYYNGTEGKDGAELKTALHNIINNHQAYSYTDVWNILKQSDEDPTNPENIMLVYTGRSQDKDHRDRGSDYDYEANGYTLADSYNREHVWAKSHGDFGTETGIGTDAHSLKPVDRTVNEARSYKDFDNGGNAHSEATECNTDSDSWEPRDEVKGDIARIIFYMDTRYEGTNGELDLTVIDAVNTFPNPAHGKLSALLEWHKQDPPDDFERRRNNVIFTWQKNRNPFIDNPEFVELIWGDKTVNDIAISNISISPEKPDPTDDVAVTADITADTEILEATLVYGADYSQISSTLVMTNTSGTYSATIPADSENSEKYFYVSARTATDTTESVIYKYDIIEPFQGTITSIKDIQGETDASPLDGQTISTAGIVTGVFGTSFYMQSGSEAWSGVYVYSSGHSPTRGDSVIVTALVDEYFELTELTNVSYYQVVSSYNPLPEPILIDTYDVATGNTDAEQYEGVFVRVENAICTEEDAGHEMWKVDDGSGDCLIHNPTTFEYHPTVGIVYNITGIATYNYDEYKIDIRDADDVTIVPDIFPPIITEVSVTSETTIQLTFNEEVDAITSEEVSNYSITDDIIVESALQHSLNKKIVVLTVSGMTHGDHTLTIINIEDLLGNAVVSQEYLFINTGIDELKNEFSIYPNPVNDILQINTTDKIKSIRIYDETGRIVFTKKYFTKDSYKLNIGNLENGLYLLQIDFGDFVNYKRIIKE